ncbi:MAG: bifunctional homocysteine S-methyltransferase/methylenetetrahydrofolate reductase [Pseudobdellovibrionaceae bacterium]|nr:bifunctional homocysteine S-methyltransferase/methylenetetrahydrofolate reductase [Bdellovibrionales bacterium]USN46235.1 MAG: bifunctional homocysteine S-methyltransferase/methylenetetrahydrofolate reductase [Pseudobdellovibrionaceae bacterium]
MNKKPLIEYLKQSDPIVADGGITTSLYDKGFYINRSFEELSVTESQAVREVTQGFKRSGATILNTNTFSATRPKLVTYGLQDQLSEIIRSASEIALEVAGPEAYVLGCIGPLGVMIEPLGPTSTDEAEHFFSENVEVFEAAGVDGINLVGFHDLNELRAAIAATRKVTNKPLFAHIGIQENMKTSYGATIPEFLKLADELGVDVVGFAGEVGPSGMLTALQKARPHTKKPISLLPNAGLPRYVNDQYIYLTNPDYVGKYAKRFIQAGANIVGGHSGMGEAHIKAIANSIRMTQSHGIVADGSAYRMPEALGDLIDQPKNQVPTRERSRLGQAFDSGEKVYSVEVVPPKGVDCSQFFNHMQALCEGGVRFVNIPDGARAVARMSSLALASYVQTHFDLEPIPHFTTRDRNLIGLQSDLLGAYVNGVRNLLLVTGDPPKLGNCPGATAVYDVDAIGLTHIVNRMNQGLDLGGSAFGQPAEFLVGVALNPTASNGELERKRFSYKVEAGANYAITQPIYDIESYKRFMDKVGDLSIPIVMGIWPLVSLRNAEFLKNEVPGVEVPDWAIEEMEKAGDDREEAIKRGIEIAHKTMQQAEKLVSGFQVSAPFNRVDVALKVIHGQ